MPAPDLTLGTGDEREVDADDTISEARALELNALRDAVGDCDD